MIQLIILLVLLGMIAERLAYEFLEPTEDGGG